LDSNQDIIIHRAVGVSSVGYLVGVDNYWNTCQTLGIRKLLLLSKYYGWKWLYGRTDIQGVHRVRERDGIGNDDDLNNSFYLGNRRRVSAYPCY